MEELSVLNTMRELPGDVLARIDQYELLRELGGGGFGTVYLAKDAVSGVEYAVKGLPPDVKNNLDELENIRDNFKLVSRLSHTNIARAHVLHPAKEVNYASEDVRRKLRVEPGDTLMVMEYAPGVTLSKWRKQFPEGKTPLDSALEIVRQVAAALDYAHGQKIIHRDIKPSNVMVETKPGGSLVVRVLDFGLAAEIRSSMGRVSREVRDTSGTRPYMAPEQWQGEDQRAPTDQYSLAVLFYELVTGKVPFASAFDTNDPVVMVNAVVDKTFSAPADLPKAVRFALETALAKNPAERFASCGDFVAALSGKKVARRTPNKGKGSFLWKSLALAVSSAAIAAGIWYWRTAEEAKRQEAARQEEAARLAAEEEAKRKEAARLAAEEEAKRKEAERLAAEEAKRKEAEHLAAEEATKRKEAARLAAEEATKRKEAARLAAEEAKRKEAARLAAEEAKRKEAARLAAEEATKRKEAARLAAEEATKRKEAARLAAEEVKRKEAERLASEEAKRKEAERLASEEEAKRKEAARLAAEEAKRKEAARLASEEAKRKEAEHLAAEEAKRKEAARKALEPPRLVIRARLNGREVEGAMIQTMNGKFKLPYTWNERETGSLSQGKSLSYEVSLRLDGNIYSGKLEATVDWHGVKTLWVDLESGDGKLRPKPKGIGSWAF